MYEAPLLSIVMPNHNNSRFIEEAINSCLSQSYENIEVIVVDDCSTDNSVSLVRKMMLAEKRIRLFAASEKLHVARARHRAIEESKGEWITTLDSDDFYCDRDKLDNEMRTLRNYDFNPWMFPFSRVCPVNLNGRYLMNEEKSIVDGDLFEAILTRSISIPRDFIFSKSSYFEVGGYDFDIPLYEDWDLKVRLSKSGRFHYTGSRGVAYRKHGTGLSSASQMEHKKWRDYVFFKNVNDVDSCNREKLYKQLSINTERKMFGRLVRRLKRYLHA